VLDSAVSLTASECFDGPGACTVRFPLSAAAALIPDRILRIPGTEEMYRISSVRCEGGTGEAEVRGEGMLVFFSRRAVPEFADRIGNAEDVLCSLALDVGAAALPGTVTAERAGVSAGVETKAGKSDLLGTMRQICGEAGVGMRLEFQPDDGSFRFSVREKKNTGVFLSRSLGNLVRAVRTEDDAGYKNRAVVLGSGGITVTADAAGLFDDGTDDVNMPVRELFMTRPTLPARIMRLTTRIVRCFFTLPGFS